MIVTRAPYRVSLFGGGSDFPSWYMDRGGHVLAFAINRYCYITAKNLPPFFRHKYRLSYSRIEEVSSLDEIKHPAFREGIRVYGEGAPLEIHHHGDLPAQSGIGSSSAFSVALIQSLKTLANKPVTVAEIANEAIGFEQRVLGENVGSQDQITCAIGGLNSIKFEQNGSWISQRIKVSESVKEEIESRCVIVHTGISRISSQISTGIINSIENKLNVNSIEKLIKLTEEAIKILENGNDLDQFGEMLQQSWQLKIKLNNLATRSEIEKIFNLAQKAGSLGGKVLGAGGGGFCMFWVRKDGREDFIAKFKPKIVVPIKIENQGVQVILHDNHNLE